jgi:hypothetical protein
MGQHTTGTGSQPDLLNAGYGRRYFGRRNGARDRATAPIEDIWCEKIRGCSYRGRQHVCLSRIAPLDQRTALPDQCLHSAEADVRPPRRKAEFDPIKRHSGERYRTFAAFHPGPDFGPSKVIPYCAIRALSGFQACYRHDVPMEVRRPKTNRSRSGCAHNDLALSVTSSFFAIL